MTKRYLVNNKIALRLLRTIDYLLSLTQFFRKKSDHTKEIPLAKVEKILVCNLAHFGDIVMSTAFLSEIRKYFPNCKIGVLIGSWSHSIVEELQTVDQIHHLDHWKLNRSATSRKKKIWHYLQQRRKVISEIKEARYDLCIDLYCYFPNAIPIIWKTKIPYRLGFSSGGFGPLLTHALEWEDSPRSMIDDQMRLFELLKLPAPPVKYPVLSDSVSSQAPELMKKNYLVFHMGAGLALKEWPESNWRAVLTHFSDLGYEIYFTGKGLEQKNAIQRVIQGVENAHDQSDLLNWKEFVTLIRFAKLLISVDSVSGHVASAYQIPTVSLFTGMNCLSKWKPVNPVGIPLLHPVPCAPCYNKRGCHTMDCIRKIQPLEVIATAEKLLGQHLLIEPKE